MPFHWFACRLKSVPTIPYWLRHVLQDNISELSGRCGRIRPVRMKNHISTLRQCFEQYPRKSTRHLFQETDLSMSAVMDKMYQYLHLFSHKIHMSQLQTGADKVERCAFGQTIRQRILYKATWLLGLHFFWVTRQISNLVVTWTNSICAFGSGSAIYEHRHPPLSVEKVTVWCALGPNDIRWRYWFENAGGRLATVNTERYFKPVTGCPTRGPHAAQSQVLCGPFRFSLL